MSDAAKWLKPNPKLPPGKASAVSRLFYDLSLELQGLNLEGTWQGDEGMQRLLEAKDCFVRAALDREEQAR